MSRHVFHRVGSRWKALESETRIGLVAAIAVMLILGTIAGGIFSIISVTSTSHAAAQAAQTSAHDSKVLQTLLTNGKTTSAINSKKTELLAEEIKALIQSGKSAGAQQSALAAKSAVEANTLLHTALTLLIGQIDQNRANGLITRQILCAAVEESHPENATIKALCK